MAFKVGHFDKVKGENITDPNAKMSDVRLRQALVYGLDVEQMVKAFYYGLRERATMAVPPAFKKYYSKEGYLDFELFSKSENFLKGIKKLENSMEKNYVIVLMCAEKDPIICHRAIMISKIFSEKGYGVIHLLPNNATITQKDIEDRLIKKFFPNKGQLLLFETEEVVSEKEYIKRAYNKQNAEIGYSKT